MLSSTEPTNKKFYDPLRALDAFKSACVQGGDSNSCGLAGTLLLNSENRYKDVAQKIGEKERKEVAEDLFKRGCSGGYAR
ncbi:hypothetical protein TL16_g05866 [Triparma laevis f. inornata]|nr:hypothetical protein TL16_g05866 [Triparma laevis f. inornata]